MKGQSSPTLLEALAWYAQSTATQEPTHHKVGRWVHREKSIIYIIKITQ